MSFALLVKAKSFFTFSARIFKFIGMYLHVNAKVAPIGTFFVAPFEGTLPFLPMCVQMSVEVGISYETSIAFLALETVVRMFVFMRVQFTFKVKRF